MRPELKFEKINMIISDLGEETGVPDLVGSLILQNDLEFHLDEEDEIYEGFGKRKNSYPYRQYNCYTRELKVHKLDTAVLENDFIRALFLPALGGRLWELWDKETGKNLLYTNDVIRYSNLAIRNAWFSGGVEWNIGIIGHTPLTVEQLYTAVLEDENGNPVLRMYEYERLRGVEYQMDFWLGETDRFLNCRMRIVNSTSGIVPMYWWSNMAVPEYKEGRVVVPAVKAFSSNGRNIYKVDIPVVNGVDVTSYEKIPKQVDYFFDIPAHSPKFIANLDESGYGLLHISTSRLKSRKLFSWGCNAGSDRWQEFLTKDAGRYVEIQAGLGKTQYGCIPMAPHTAWEWMEQYGPVQIPQDVKSGAYDVLCGEMEGLVRQEIKERQLEETLKSRKSLALTKGNLIFEGNGYGKLAQAVREYSGERELSEHLEFREKPEQKEWQEFLKTGVFMERSGETKPGEFISDEIFCKRLRETIKTLNEKNWYAHYHLAVMEADKGNWETAEADFLKALELCENPWCHHGLAALYLLEGKNQQSMRHMSAGLKLRRDDLGYVKEGFKLLMLAGGYGRLLESYDTLPVVLRNESRIFFNYMVSLAKSGDVETARTLLKPGFELADLREGEDSISDLWKLIYGGDRAEDLPAEWNFYSL